MYMFFFLFLPSSRSLIFCTTGDQLQLLQLKLIRRRRRRSWKRNREETLFKNLYCFYRCDWIGTQKFTASGTFLYDLSLSLTFRVKKEREDQDLTCSSGREELNLKNCRLAMGTSSTLSHGDLFHWRLFTCTWTIVVSFIVLTSPVQSQQQQLQLQQQQQQQQSSKWHFFSFPLKQL